MTHHDPDPTTISTALELLTEQGFEGLSTALELLLNEAMKLERSEFLGAGPYERTGERRGFANGYKPKRLKSRLGELELRIPKVRELPDGAEQATATRRSARAGRARRSTGSSARSRWRSRA